MRALVVYESLFGNTRRVAEAVAAGLSDAYQVTVVPADDVPGDLAAEAELVVLGGPTHVFGVSSRRTREAGIRDADPAASAGATSVETGVREVVLALPSGDGRAATAFDTRADRPAIITGGAAHGLARMLRRRGYRPAAPPESFVVTGITGPLGTGELDRARAWGAELARLVMPPALAGRYPADNRPGREGYGFPDGHAGSDERADGIAASDGHAAPDRYAVRDGHWSSDGHGPSDGAPGRPAAADASGVAGPSGAAGAPADGTATARPDAR